MPVTIARSVDLSVVGANGGGWCTDLGAAAPAVPTTFDANPDAAFLPLGAVSEDGLTYAFDEDSQQFISWGLLSPYRTQVTRSLRSFEVTCWETNRAICKSAMYRLPVATVTPDVGGDYAFSESAAPAPDRRSWIFDVIDGNTMERMYVPVGEVTNRENVEFKPDAISGYKFSITAYADGAGITVYHLGHVQLTAS